MKMISPKELAQYIQLPRDRSQLPTYILQLSPCSSSSSSCMKVYSAAGVDLNCYQPLKEKLRALIAGEKPDIWQIPEMKWLFAKETLGYRNDQESCFDFLETLLLATYPKEKIILITLLREPMQCAASWIKKFSAQVTAEGITITESIPPETLIKNVTMAYRSVWKIYQKAIQLGIQTIPLVYEAIRDNGPAQTMQQVLNKIGLPFKEDYVIWSDAPQFDEEKGRYHFPQLGYKHHHVDWGKVSKLYTHLAYYAQTQKEIDLYISKDYGLRLKKEGLWTIYEALCKHVRLELNLTVHSSDELARFLERTS